MRNLFIIILTVFGGSNAFSQVMDDNMSKIYLSKETSPYIFEGILLEKYSYWDDTESMIYTCNIIEVHNVLRGAPDIQRGTIQLITSGGIVGTHVVKISHGVFIGERERIFFCMLSEMPSYNIKTANHLVLHPYSQIVYNKDGSSTFVDKKFRTLADVKSFFNEYGKDIDTALVGSHYMLELEKISEGMRQEKMGKSQGEKETIDKLAKEQKEYVRKPNAGIVQRIKDMEDYLEKMPEGEDKETVKRQIALLKEKGGLTTNPKEE